MIKPKKSLGQHFLNNQHTAARIADAVSAECETVVEVGPGQGILTKELAARNRRLILIEKDDDLADLMQKEYAANDKVHLMRGDFLRVDLAQILAGQQACLAGNFPYNISSQIVFRMLELRHSFTEMVGMFQLEVARRITASPGSKEYGILSVLTQVSYHGCIVMKVAPGQFNPPPKVQSGVVKLVRRVNYDPPCSYSWLRTVVKRSFNQRRKMLRKTLRDLIEPTTLTKNPLFTKRPEQLNIDEFCTLANMAQQFSEN